jgi:hypothetical protein
MLLFDKVLRNLVKICLVAVILFAILFATSLVLDWRMRENNYVSQKVIIGRGSAEIKAIPDVANFIFSVKKIQKEAKDAQQKMLEVSGLALQILDKKGVAKKDIKTINYSTYPEYEKSEEYSGGTHSNSKNTLKGFASNQTFSVKVRDIAKASEILNELSSLGIEEVGGLTFVIDSMEKIKYQARIQAIINAKVQAQSTASALNVKLKRIIKFAEDDNNGFQPLYARASMSASDNSKNSEIQVGEESVRSSVVVTYEFE